MVFRKRVEALASQGGERAAGLEEFQVAGAPEAIAFGKRLVELVSRGDLVVISAGVPVGETGTTNLMKVHVIGETVAKGQGIGRYTAAGRVVVAGSAEEANAKMTEGAVLVTQATDKDMMPAVEKALAVVTEEGGLTSHAAVVGLNLGIPVVVGVEEARSLFEDGEEITVDASRGDIYRGHASVL